MMRAAGSALVARNNKYPNRGTMRIRATRGFMHLGNVVSVGTLIELPDATAREIVALNKGERVEEMDEAPTEADAGETTALPKRRGRPPKVREET
jgi:hypothetical protein